MHARKSAYSAGWAPVTNFHTQSVTEFSRKAWQTVRETRDWLVLARVAEEALQPFDTALSPGAALNAWF
jgi:hypothetical protein